MCRHTHTHLKISLNWKACAQSVLYPFPCTSRLQWHAASGHQLALRRQPARLCLNASWSILVPTAITVSPVTRVRTTEEKNAAEERHTSRFPMWGGGTTVRRGHGSRSSLSLDGWLWFVNQFLFKRFLLFFFIWLQDHRSCPVLISPPALAPDLAVRQREKWRDGIKYWGHGCFRHILTCLCLQPGGSYPMLQKSQTQQHHPVSLCVSESADVAKTWTESFIKIKMLLSNK